GGGVRSHPVGGDDRRRHHGRPGAVRLPAARRAGAVSVLPQRAELGVALHVRYDEAAQRAAPPDRAGGGYGREEDRDRLGPLLYAERQPDTVAPGAVLAVLSPRV